MGTLANSLFLALLGWIRTLSAEIWNTLFSPGRTTLLSWLGEHWKGLALALCAAGLTVDLIVYLFRWQPYRVWMSRRRGKRESDEEAGYAGPVPAAPEAEPTQAARNGDRWDSRKDIVPEKPIARMDPGGTRDGADFREETELSDVRPERSDRLDDPDVSEPEEGIIPEEVQEDSRQAYRRPAERYIRNAYDADSEEEQLAAWRWPEESDPPAEEERVKEKFEQAIRPRRRRSVRAMLTDRPEGSAPAPEQLIDRNEAYRRPVYPRSWKENE